MFVCSQVGFGGVLVIKRSRPCVLPDVNAAGLGRRGSQPTARKGRIMPGGAKLFFKKMEWKRTIGGP